MIPIQIAIASTKHETDLKFDQLGVIEFNRTKKPKDDVVDDDEEEGVEMDTDTTNNKSPNA
jgi:hypothetical protein